MDHAVTLSHAGHGDEQVGLTTLPTVRSSGGTSNAFRIYRQQCVDAQAELRVAQLRDVERPDGAA
jgi:hypothetical protein